MVWFALVLLVLFSFAGFAVDVAHLWFTAQKVQKAADAGALAGASFMPSDLPGARARARELAARNGYAESVSGYATNATVTVTQEPNPYRVRVRISYTARTFFASLMGVDQLVVTREAVGEYQGPVPMGSPTNNLGNQPVGSGDTGWYATDPPLLANSNPQVWAQIAGPETDKANGDRFATAYCGTTGTYNCTGAVNNERSSNGYYFVARVQATAADLSKYLVIQAYDPAFVQTGNECDDFDGDGSGGVGDPDEVTIRNELVALGVDRYRAPAPYDQQQFNSTFCPGDHYVRGGYSANLPTTTFTVRQADQTPWNNADNPVVASAGCTPTAFAPLRGRPAGDGTRLPALLNPANGAATAVYARAVYHRWVPVCVLPLAELGVTTPGQHDVLLQITTTGGAGHNRFSLRTGLSASSSVTGVDAAATTMFASGRLPLYANAAGADSRFYLARLLPGNAGRTLSIQLFDVGDAADVGQIQILPPSDATIDGATISRFSGCTFTRLPAGGTAMTTSSSECRISNVRSSTGYNGRMVIVNVPIADGYDCDDGSPTGCWVLVRFSYGSGVAVTDTTTWSANILGDPVRLVE